jgi:ribosomal protein S18 acetylase RimI-like enzyme
VSKIARADRVRRKGNWPGRVELTSGWGRVIARPWNDNIDAAALRFDRGSARFLQACARIVKEWTDDVLSPATLPSSARVWRDAGFVENDRLLLLESRMAPLPAPSHRVESGALEPFDEIYAIDQASFPPTWRLGRLGLAESVAATSRSVVLRTKNEGGSVVGFAICGVSLGTGYLQRLAVDPTSRSQGMGASLVAAAMGWARRHGSATLLVNTQTDNEPAASLYRRMGFVDVPGGLLLLRYQGEP